MGLKYKFSSPVGDFSFFYKQGIYLELRADEFSSPVGDFSFFINT